MGCKKCKMELGLFNSFFGTELCTSCHDKEKLNLKKDLKKERANEKNKNEKDSEISDTIGEVLTDELKFEIDYIQDGTFIKKLKNGKFKITEKEIRNGLKNKEINEDNIIEFVNYQIEVAKLKLRSKQYELKKIAEKEVFGKSKNNRQAFSDDEKESILANSNNECTICCAKEGLYIHHKDKNPSNNQISNLLVLCGVCHKKVHMKVR